MRSTTITIAGLLHDIGKIIRRADNKGTHSFAGAEFLQKQELPNEIINATRYHHKKELQNAELSNNDIAYIVYIADNIASAFDRRHTEQLDEKAVFNEKAPLKSIFNLLNNNSNNLGYSYVDNYLSTKLSFPSENINLSQGVYRGIKK